MNSRQTHMIMWRSLFCGRLVIELPRLCINHCLGRQLINRQIQAMFQLFLPIKHQLEVLKLNNKVKNALKDMTRKGKQPKQTIRNK